MGFCSVGSSLVIMAMRLFPIRIIIYTIENTPNRNPWRYGKSENPSRTNCFTVETLSSAFICSYFICGNDLTRSTNHLTVLNICFSPCNPRNVHILLFPIPRIIYTTLQVFLNYNYMYFSLLINIHVNFCWFHSSKRKYTSLYIWGDRLFEVLFFI
jgi:hypothetical protein